MILLLHFVLLLHYNIPSVFLYNLIHCSAIKGFTIHSRSNFPSFWQIIPYSAIIILFNHPPYKLLLLCHLQFQLLSSHPKFYNTLYSFDQSASIMPPTCCCSILRFLQACLRLSGRKVLTPNVSRLEPFSTEHTEVLFALCSGMRSPSNIARNCLMLHCS